MPKENIIEQLEEKGYSRNELHQLVHKILLLQVEGKGKAKKSLYHRVLIFISHCTKKLEGVAVSLLRTQFAKKPKNPV